MPWVPPVWPWIFLNDSVFRNHWCSSRPRTPRGLFRSCRGPAPNPSSEIENAATLTLAMGFPYLRFSIVLRVGFRQGDEFGGLVIYTCTLPCQSAWCASINGRCLRDYAKSRARAGLPPGRRL